MLKIVSIDYKKYPFLAELDTIINRRWPGLTILDLIKLSSDIKDRCLEILEHVIKNGSVRVCRYLTTEDEVLAFYLAVIILSILNNRWLIERFSIAYSKYAQEHLKNEADYVVEAIGRKLGIDIVYDSDHCPKIPVLKRKLISLKILPYSIALKDYLRYSKRLINDPKYALINQIVDKGRVYVDRDVAIRIIVEAITEHIRGLIKPLREYPREFDELVNKVNELIKLVHEPIEVKHEANKESSQAGRPKTIIYQDVDKIIDFDAFPPCMSNLIESLKRGENLSHQARFAIAAFLSKIGMSVDEILELFKNVPDFNEKIARYQIEHISGLRGSRKQYMPYSCSTMKSLGLCPLVDRDCGVKNPLVAYRRNLIKKLKSMKRGRKGREESSK